VQPSCVNIFLCTIYWKTQTA